MRQSTKRLLSMFASLFLILGAFVLYFNFIQPAYKDAQILRGKNLSKENFISNQTQAVKQVRNLISAYKGQGELQQTVSAAFPIGDDTPDALNQLVGLANISNLAVQSISVTPQSFQLGAPTFAAASSSLSQPAGVTVFDMKLTGSYENLKSFFGDLETNVKIFDLRSLSVQALPTTPISPGKQPAPLDLYNFSVSVATYYQIPKAAL